MNRHRHLFGRFFGLNDGFPHTEQLRAGNSVLSGLLDGLAVYGSDLGAHTIKGGEPYPHKQVRFFIIYGGPSRGQLGRLLRHILYCGEMRVIGLRQFQELRVAGKQISRFAEQYDDLENSLMNETGDGTLSSTDQLKELDRELDNLSPNKLGWIRQRATRSKFYYKLLEDFIKQLRTVRFEGWQTYDEFIYSRMRSSFLSLAATLDQINTLQETRRRIDGRILSARLALHTTSLDDGVGDLRKLQQNLGELFQTTKDVLEESKGLHEINSHVSRMNQIQNEITSEIQAVGELLAFAGSAWVLRDILIKSIPNVSWSGSGDLPEGQFNLPAFLDLHFFITFLIFAAGAFAYWLRWKSKKARTQEIKAIKDKFRQINQESD
ncbi:DUF3422 family protein [Hyphobacterium sp.]|uniref:DUF3422 family protein n=1 Tax=Hyphobacterium sp. TaxID=2004662 RepID=UPI003748CA63